MLADLREDVRRIDTTVSGNRIFLEERKRLALALDELIRLTDDIEPQALKLSRPESIPGQARLA